MSTTTAQTTQIYQLFIRATPEAVWEAITKPEFTQKYFYGSRVEIGAGEYVGRFADGSVGVSGRMIDLDPPRRLVHGWKSLYDPELAEEDESRVTWEIEPQEGGLTKLTVVHDQLQGAPKTAASVSDGWMFVLSGLKTLLETGEPLVG